MASWTSLGEWWCQLGWLEVQGQLCPKEAREGVRGGWPGNLWEGLEGCGALAGVSAGDTVVKIHLTCDTVKL